MTSTRGLDPFPRGYDVSMDKQLRSALAAQGRCVRALRAARRRGLPTSSMEYQTRIAGERVARLIDQAEHMENNPALFDLS